MPPSRVIFVSAVSKEFHTVLPQAQQRFHSYRDVLKQAFFTLAKEYEVIVQEDLPLGPGDLLETLDHEVARSLLVIHLVGDLAGFAPEAAPLGALQERHPDLLERVPELREALEQGMGITYTQWELYLTFYHGRGRFIFQLGPGAPRSPAFTDPSPTDQASQAAHRRRIKARGAHRGPALHQGDVARKSMRSFLHFRVDPKIDPHEPTDNAVAEARVHQEEIVNYLVQAIKHPDPRAVPVTDPANTAAWIAGVRSAAQRWQVNLATIAAIAAHYEEDVRSAAEGRPTPQTLYDAAIAELALGDYTAAGFWARRAANLALELLKEQPMDESLQRDAALNAL